MTLAACLCDSGPAAVGVVRLSCGQGVCTLEWVGCAPTPDLKEHRVALLGLRLHAPSKKRE